MAALASTRGARGGRIALASAGPRQVCAFLDRGALSGCPVNGRRGAVATVAPARRLDAGSAAESRNESEARPLLSTAAMRVLPVVVCVVVVGLAARAEAGGGFFLMVPPMRVDVGALTVTGDGVAMGTQIVAGVHLASVWPGDDLPIDVGVGVVGAFIGDDGDGSATIGKASVDEGTADPSFIGGYFDLSSRLAHGRHWRTWAGARGEMLRSDVAGTSDIGVGAGARLAAEVFVGGGGAAGGGSGGGVAVGVFALGVYADVSHRDLDGPLGGFGMSSGVTLRVPFIFVGG